MNGIKHVEIQPDTTAERVYIVGKSDITDIKDVLDNGITTVQIYKDNKLYAEYVNVPYAIFYGSDDTTQKQK